MELILRIWPDPALTRRADEVNLFDAELTERVERMWEVMYESGGVGLAAPQVGWAARLLVLNPSGSRDDPDGELVVVNPRMVKRWGKDVAQEGCLSFPEIFVDVARPAGIRLAWQDQRGEAHEADFNEFPARILQHEMDHLEGVLLVHRMSPVDRIRYRRDLEALVAEATTG
jgi:peptide deformylase